MLLEHIVVNRLGLAMCAACMPLTYAFALLLLCAVHSYEAYGPGGTGFVIEALTDNVNRTAGEAVVVVILLAAAAATVAAVAAEAAAVVPHQGCI